jgi:hypothetical protein
MNDLFAATALVAFIFSPIILALVWAGVTEWRDFIKWKSRTVSGQKTYRRFRALRDLDAIK